MRGISLGQYFTNPDVVDLILKFCLRHELDKLLDPSCGAGDFLVKGLSHKKTVNQFLSHEKILETLWGDDIAKFSGPPGNNQPGYPRSLRG
jgi:hypothetical protein